MKVKAILSVCICWFITIGCDDETPTAPEPNRQPVIDALIVPSTIVAGQKVTLQAVSHDPDGDKLVVEWEASGGSFNEASQEWTAPDNAGTVVITVYVSDGINKSVNAKKTIQVKPAPVEPPPPIPPSIQPMLPPPQDPPVDREQTPPVQQNPEPAKEPEYRIVPRQGLTSVAPGLGTVTVTIGSTLEEVKRLHGEPEELEEGSFVFGSERLGAFAVRLEDNRVIMIVTVDPRYKTVQGIGIGSDRDDVLLAFGAPDPNFPDPDVDFYLWKGISFSYDNLSRVKGILIF